ncbi:hypothetical protein TTHERM_00093950 (macronuclear) [Tetrahymena thermophila SB210]|uniref:Uncharacterized protein n=1 Tax=Tetrahymena thermophila (strain SB210) TaxID=312017 RepID=Q235Z6_TETTS|nr:hypothetical protein TTHERM_00093950 [Tetrahymena thermophila SB210]EAR92604.1 hypothetical protein TTHERM_00093950 [Tetrahymena thermophila SB210]|eukprot:XP_001012849.1 hypothetical protein TTHERM_00093950 [Tetrahymena thermophila SB210]
MNPVKITVLGVKKKAVPSNLISSNIKILTDNSENIKTEENIQEFLNANSNWNICNLSQSAGTYISKSQLESDPKAVDPSKFVDVNKYTDIAHMCKQDLLDQKIDLLEYNLQVRQNCLPIQSNSNQDTEKQENSGNNMHSMPYFQKNPKKQISQEEKEEMKQRLIRKQKILQIKNQQLVSYFADKKKSIYSFDPTLLQEQKNKKEKMFRKPNFLQDLKNDLVNDEKTVKFIEKNWFLFSQSAENPNEYIQGIKKIKDVYDELKSRIQRQQEKNLEQKERALIQEILEQQRKSNYRRSLSTKKNQKKDQTSDKICMFNAATAANTPKKNSKKYKKSGTQYSIKIRQTQDIQEKQNLSQTIKYEGNNNYLHFSSQNKSLRINNEDIISSPSNYYSIEGDPNVNQNQSLYENQIKLERPPQLHLSSKAKFDERVKFSQNNTNSSVSTRILDSRIRTTSGSKTSILGTPSTRTAFHSRKNTEVDLNRNQEKILQINGLKLNQRQRSATNNSRLISNSNYNNKNRIQMENNDQIFNFCHSAISESEIINIQGEEDYENEYDQNELRNKINNSFIDKQNSQLSNRSQLNSSTTLQESSRGTSFSLDNPSSYTTNVNFLNRKRKYLNMNEIKITTYTAKELYLQEHNPLKYELYVVPQATKDLISKANKQGTYLYQKQFTPKNYGQVSNIKRELIIS